MDKAMEIGKWLGENIKPGLRLGLTIVGIGLLLLAMILNWLGILVGFSSAVLTISVIILVPRLMIAAHDAVLVDKQLNR